MVARLKYMFSIGSVSFRYSLYSTLPKMKVLNVAEKNDAAKTLAGFMSSNIKRREGFSKYNKIYEFETMLFGQKCDMIMTSVSGHLLGLEFVGAYRGWRSCNPLSLFDAPIHKQCIPGYEDIKRTLEREARKCSVLIIWTDCDREGESIGFEIIEVCKSVKPNVKVYRAKFSEITFQSVKRALQNLSQPDKKTNDAVNVRQELDLRIGAAFTRFQTLRLRQVFPESLRESLISYGSCQFPTLGFVVERYKAIESFIPEPFWKIKVVHDKNDVSVEFLWKRGRLFDELVCHCFYELCVENPIATVQSVTSKPKSKWRPLPLDTVELEKVGSRKLKMNAKEVMKIAEKLYTQGFISYPRTETNIFPKEINLANLIGMQTADPAWGEFASIVLQDGPNPRNGTKSDKAHPPIHPIKYTNNLSGNDQKVYEFVVRRFLACCSKDAEGHETIVEINIANELFVANGLMIIAKNYLEVYPYEKWNAKEIHVYQLGETFKPIIELVDGTTSPPKLLTEADLIALMEKHGIGTDATHAEHIEKIKSRLYVGLENNRFFVPGHLGMGLVEGYDSMGFPMSKPHLRSELESDLVKICEGRKNPEVVLKEQLMKYKQVFEVALQQAAKIDEALAIYLQEPPCQPEAVVENNFNMPSNVCKCPACNSGMVLKTKRDSSGKYLSCINFPQCRTAVWFPNIVQDVETTNESCSQCGPDFKKLKFKFMSGALPRYYIPEGASCIGGCDRDLLEILGIQIRNIRSHANDLIRNTSNTITSTNTSTNDLSTSRSQSSNSSVGNSSSTVHAPASNISSSNSRNSDRHVSGRGRAQPAGQRSILDIFQPSGSGSNSTASSTRGTINTNQLEPNNENLVMCNCNHPALQLTVRKEGPNTGRLFYKCGNDNHCNFFQWADSTSHLQPQNNSNLTSRQTGGRFSDSGIDRTVSHMNSQLHSGGPRTTNRNTEENRPISNIPTGVSGSIGSFVQDSSVNPSSGRFTFANHSNVTNISENVTRDDDALVCGCNVNAILLTVKKDGPNKGRQFYKCGNMHGPSCNFFLWADNSLNVANESSENSAPNHTVRSWQQRQNQPMSGFGDSDDNANDVMCRCGGPARRLIVQKDGPNKGRPFYSCPKSVDRCQFFMWADEGTSSNPGVGHGSTSNNWRRNIQGQNADNSNDAKKKRKCGNCREEGHTKRSCPNN